MAQTATREVQHIAGSRPLRPNLRPLETTVKVALALEQAIDDDVKILALTIDERAIILNALDDPPDELAELRAVLMNEHQWRQAQGP